MGRRTKKVTRASVARKEATARACDEGGQYVPGIRTTEVPSRGNCYRVLGATTGRVHHLLSSLEYAYFLRLDFDRSVTDIREQYLLPISETVMIAAGAGIDPPRHGGVILHTSTDFYFLRDGAWHARAVKPSGALSSARTREKLEIERLYWAGRGTDWGIVTERELDPRLTKGIEWARSGDPLTALIPDPALREEACAAFLVCYRNPRVRLGALTEYLERHYGLPAGGGLQIFKHLIASGRLRVDLGSPYLLTDPRRCTDWEGH